MSVASEITRINNAKASIKSSIEAKGVTVPSSATIDTYSTYISEIPQSGGSGGHIITDEVWPYSDTGFTLQKAVKSVEVPSGVTSIGNDAFRNCSSLTDVTLPDSVTIIDIYAFYSCDNLSGLTIPDRVTSIGQSAFGQCSSLSSITIPDSVTSIYSYAFQDCTGLTAIAVNATTPPTLGIGVFYNTNECPIYVPAGSVETYKAAQGWSDYANRIESSTNFKLYLTYSGGTTYLAECDGDETLTTATTKPSGYDFSTITDAVVGNCISGTSSQCFMDATALSAVTLMNTEVLGSGLFHHCTGLTTVNLPNTLTTINSSVFFQCTSLSSITIPNSVTYIDQNAFSGCSSLTSLNIPSGVTQIRPSLLSYCTSLTSVTIPSGVTIIDDYAFLGCSALSSITIPNGVTTIGATTFKDCTSLTAVTVPSGVTSIGYGVFRNCTGLTSLTFKSTTPPTIEGVYAFDNTNNCPIYVPAESVETYKAANRWSDYASRIQAEANIPMLNITYSDSSNYSYYSTGVTDTVITTAMTRPEGYTVSAITSVVINDPCTEIGNNALSGATSMTSLTIADTVTSIGNSAFYSCRSLSSIIIPDGVTSISNSVFGRCSGLTSINIPSGVTSIGQSAFSGCSSLTSINIPSGVTSISDKCFYGCSGLTTLTIPSGVTTIGSGVCQNCFGLTSIIIPDGVTSIGQNSFQSGYSLTTVDIGTGITSFGKQVFNNCTGLTSITIRATTPPTLGTAVFNNTNECPIYVPAGSVETYKTASGWSTYSSRIQAIPSN